MGSSKIFKTLDQQIEILRNKGLVINDEPFARKILFRENYYFVTGYRHLFMDKPRNGNYLEGTTFEELYAMFIFDRKIRTTRLDTAQVGSFHIAPTGQFLYRKPAFSAQLSNSPGDIKYLLSIIHSHFKNYDKNFAVQIFIFIFAPCVSYMIPAKMKPK